ncbi:MAG: hypothetical protein KAX49_14510 [Halanaerobiales bacterium]|nr:hypothetical protein [Halanaerobiales bacterium]
MRKNGSDGRWFGILLIMLGAILLLGRYNLISGDHFLYFIAGGFYFAYFTFGGSRHYGNIGFLIPGNVLFAINLFANLENVRFFDNLGGGMFFIFLAIAFLVVYLHTRTFHDEDWGARSWPLFPAGGLTCFGILIILSEQFEFINIGELFGYLSGIILIGVGCFLFIKGKQIKRSEED